MSYSVSQLRFFLLLICSSLVMCGCSSTAEVLNKKQPEKYLEVIQDDPAVDVEKSLQASGQKYICKEIYIGRGSSENRRACFVKAPDESKYKEIGVKLSQLPAAMLDDTSHNIVVVGKVFLHVLLGGPVKI
jgi:hypothetical protein